MYLAEGVAELARRFDKKSDDAKFKPLAIAKLGLAVLDVGKSWDWFQLLQYGSITAIPSVTGTITLTAGNQSVQLAGATAAYMGRFFRQDGGENTYRIQYVDIVTSPPTLYFDQPIIESGAVSFVIEKRFYTIPTEVRKIIGWDRQGMKVLSIDHQGLRSVFTDRQVPLSDVPFEIFGVDEYTDTYKTGTISTPENNSDIVTAESGTPAWLTNAFPGNILRVVPQGGTETAGVVAEYRIKRAETDSRLRLYNKIAGKLTGESYQILVDSALTLRPRADFSSQKIIQFAYIRTVFPMVHDDDRIRLSREAELAILDFAEAHVAESLPQAGWETKLIKAQGRLASAQANASPVRATFKMFPPLIARGMGRR